MRADLAVAGQASRRRAPLAVRLAVLAPLAAVLALLAHALAPYHFGGAALRDELAVQLRATGGLRLTLHHARFTLLPRPRVTADAVHVDDSSAAVTLDADGLVGDVRLLPLLVGRVELSGVALERPRITLDLAAAAAAEAGHRAGAGAITQRLGSLTITNGALRIARGDAAPLSLGGIDAVIDWTDRTASATVSGSAEIDGQRLALALWLGAPTALRRGEASAMTLHLHGSDGDLAAEGTIAAAEAGIGFNGHVSATATSLAALVARAAPAAILPAPFAEASVEADTRIAIDGHGPATIDLQNLSFQADGTAWEGTLAFRRGTRPLVSATLATNRLMLMPFAARLPVPLDAGRRWSTAVLPPPRVGDVDLDLRISASRIVAPPFAVDEAALAVISKERRIEITLIDGRLAGGAVKGRVTLGGKAGELDLRASAALDGANALTLATQLTGRPLARGLLAASAEVASHGSSVAALVAGLDGSVTVSLRDGEIIGSGGDRIAVTVAAMAAHLAGGVAAIDPARLAGPDLALSATGSLDLPRQLLDLHATRSRGGRTAPQDVVTITGPLDDLAVRTEAP